MSPSGKIKETPSPGMGGFMRPDEILKNFDIKLGMKIADFGCGAGYFTIPLAKHVGKEGIVYAIDVLQTALESVEGRARMYSLLNIETIRANLEKEHGSTLDDASVEMVILSNVLFQSKLKEDILKEAKRVLKKTGKIVVIEWNDDAILGPNVAYRILKEQLKKLVKEVGFVLEKEFQAGDSHYGLVFSL